jgi:hypothetical protein
MFQVEAHRAYMCKQILGLCQKYRHLGLENKSNTWHPMLYLIYSGVGIDGKVIFEDEICFDKSMPSLEHEGGHVSEYPNREVRAKRRATGV